MGYYHMFAYYLEITMVKV